MAHFVERDDHDVGFGRWFRKFARRITHPVQNRHIADAENARDGAKADVPDGIWKQGQGPSTYDNPARDRPPRPH